MDTMSDSSHSPLLAAFVDLVEAERAYAEQVKTAKTQAEQQREEARRAYEQFVRNVDEPINRRKSLPEKLERSFVDRGLPVHTYTYTGAPPTMAGDGDVEAEFYRAIQRVDDLVAALERSWRDYDEATATEAVAAQRLLTAAGAAVVAVVLGALALVSQIGEQQALAALTAAAMTRSAILQATPFPDVTLTALLARMSVDSKNYISANADWTPFVWRFDGVSMVLVPAGCFMMGSESGQSDEQPAHEQCFAEPFWIDQTEVTQAQFAAFRGRAARASYFSGDDRPIENISWFEARDFCAQRGARLPTEAEWEYASRGPDSLLYPWGDDWNPDNAVYSGNSNNETADVVSRPAGASWVGALDMSGNVWEWVSSSHGLYPYNRETDAGSGASYGRVIRGGSWDAADAGILRTAVRVGRDPNSRAASVGFRCARSS